MLGRSVLFRPRRPDLQRAAKFAVCAGLCGNRRTCSGPREAAVTKTFPRTPHEPGAPTTDLAGRALLRAKNRLLAHVARCHDSGQHGSGIGLTPASSTCPRATGFCRTNPRPHSRPAVIPGEYRARNRASIGWRSASRGLSLARTWYTAACTTRRVRSSLPTRANSCASCSASICAATA